MSLPAVSSFRLMQRCASVASGQVRSNAHRASLGSVTRTQYLKRYPVQMVRPDGSSVCVRAAEPLRMFALPIDLKALSEEERLTMLAARKPKAKKIVQEKIDDNFDASSYMNFWSVDDAPATPAAKASGTVPSPPAAKAAAPPVEKKEKAKKKKQ